MRNTASDLKYLRSRSSKIRVPGSVKFVAGRSGSKCVAWGDWSGQNRSIPRGSEAISQRTVRSHKPQSPSKKTMGWKIGGCTLPA